MLGWIKGWHQVDFWHLLFHYTAHPPISQLSQYFISRQGGVEFYFPILQVVCTMAS